MSEKAGPELDVKLAEAVGFHLDEGMLVDRQKCPRTMGRWSERIEQAVSMAEELRKAGRIDAWDIHQFETSRASTGRLMPNGRTLAWADAVQGETPAHALTLALLAALR